jgi:hypothetical protein
MNDERREYFRIEDMAFVKSANWSAEQTSLPEYFPQFRQFNLFHELDLLAQKETLLADEIQDKASLQYMALISKKLDILGKSLSISQLEHLDFAPQKVTISEGGICFFYDEEIASNTETAMMLIFTPSYMSLYLRATVVNCRAENGGFIIHAEFKDIPEVTRTSLAKHLLMMQTKQK